MEKRSNEETVYHEKSTAAEKSTVRLCGGFSIMLLDSSVLTAAIA